MVPSCSNHFQLTSSYGNIFSNLFQPVPGLIETLSEDRASVMREKKQLEEELNRLRGTAMVSSAFFAPNTSAQEPPDAAAPTPAPAAVPVAAAASPSPSSPAAVAASPVDGACASESTADVDRLASVAALRDDDLVESAVEASMVAVK